MTSSSSGLNPLAREFHPSGIEYGIISTSSESEHCFWGGGVAAAATSPLPNVMVSRLNPNAREFVPPSLVDDAKINDGAERVSSSPSLLPLAAVVEIRQSSFNPPCFSSEHRDEDNEDHNGNVDSPPEEASWPVPHLLNRNSGTYESDVDVEETEFVELGGGCGCGIFPPERCTLAPVASAGRGPRHRSTLPSPPMAPNHAAASWMSYRNDDNYYSVLPDWDDDDSEDATDYDDDEHEDEDEDEDDDSTVWEMEDDDDMPPGPHQGDHHTTTEDEDDNTDGHAVPPLLEIISSDDESEGGRYVGRGFWDLRDDFHLGRRHLLSREQVLALPEVKYDCGGASSDKDSVGRVVPAPLTGGFDRPQDWESRNEERDGVKKSRSPLHSTPVEKGSPESDSQAQIGAGDDEDEGEINLDDCIGRADSVLGDGCCAICLEDFKRGEKVRVLPVCRHAFHTEHIMPWLTRGRGCCPLCNAKVLEQMEEGNNDGEDAASSISFGTTSMAYASLRPRLLHIIFMSLVNASFDRLRVEVEAHERREVDAQRDAIRGRHVRSGSRRRSTTARELTRAPRMQRVHQRPRRPRGGFTHRNR